MQRDAAPSSTSQYHQQRQPCYQDRCFVQNPARPRNLYGDGFANACSHPPLPSNYAGASIAPAPGMRTVPPPTFPYREPPQRHQHTPLSSTMEPIPEKWQFIGERPQAMTQQPLPQGPPPAYTTVAPSPRQAARTIPVLLDNGANDGCRLIAIPATSAKLGSPFIRAYPPELQGYGISRQAFVQFVDRLNRAAVASPPIQVLGLAGNIVSFVPLHTAQIVGNAVNFAATVSTVAVSKGRAEMLLDEANSTLFKAAGLKAQVAKLDVVARLANIPILDSEGKVDKKSSIMLPFEEQEELYTMKAQHRRVQALSPWLSPLDMEPLPELDVSTNVLGKMHAKVSEQQRQKEEAKMVKDRKKMYKDYTKDMAKENTEYDKKIEQYATKKSRIYEKGGRRMDKELRELEKKRDKLVREHNKEVSKIEKERRKDDKEEERIRKVLFLVIRRI